MLTRLSVAVLLASASTVWAQQVISAHSGVVHFVEGQVTLEGKALSLKFGEFPEIKNGETLATEDGRAEVLLTPGVILRIAENSAFKMVSNNRSDTRLEVLSGSALVEVGELLPTNSITLLYKDTHVDLVKKGLYRVDCDDPAKLRVYDGEARVTAKDQTLVAHKGRQVAFGTVLDMGGFDTKDTDAFMRWASRRSEYLAQANISSARTASSSGYSSYGSGLGSGYGSGFGYGAGSGFGSWAYNPFYGMFTYMPYGTGMYYSPYFGYPFYSPSNVGYFVPSASTGSAFPISSSTTSSHFATSPGGSGGVAPVHGPFGSSASGASPSLARAGGPASSAGNSARTGGVSSARASGGGSSGGGMSAGGGSRGASGGGRR